MRRLPTMLSDCGRTTSLAPRWLPLYAPAGCTGALAAGPVAAGPPMLAERPQLGRPVMSPLTEAGNDRFTAAGHRTKDDPGACWTASTQEPRPGPAPWPRIRQMGHPRNAGLLPGPRHQPLLPSWPPPGTATWPLTCTRRITACSARAVASYAIGFATHSPGAIRGMRFAQVR
jgi:hypothetical protein